jgi:Short-chain dehydrogenases of various substrate specificities
MECQVNTNSTSTIPSLAGWILIGICSILLLVMLLLELLLLPKRRKLNKECKSELLSHAVVTGGSSGIGLAIARQLIQERCTHVTLLARDVKKLNQAMEGLKEYAESIGSCTNIQIQPVNVSNVEKIVQVANDLSTSKEYPAPTMLFNVAGTSSSAAFVDTDYKEFHRLVDINYLGSVYATRAFLPHMIPKDGTDAAKKKKKKTEHCPRAIVFTSSQAGQLGVYGYTAYSASKYALRGLAEALQMEVGRDNVSIQVAFPPDTDTPGFEEEQIGKPEETKLISQTSGLFSAER